MADFRQLTDTMLASPQISPDDVSEAANQSVSLIINNRPDGEATDQPEGALIQSAAMKAGIDYLEIPITHAGFSLPQVDAMAQALCETEGKVLAYCRSGTRSTLLWAMAQAKLGMAPEEIAAAAQGAGYNVAPVRPTIDMLAAQAD